MRNVLTDAQLLAITAVTEFGEIMQRVIQITRFAPIVMNTATLLAKIAED